MKSLRIDPTEFTPDIHFNPQKRLFKISGYSRPEDVYEFYRPVMSWLDDFEKEELEPDNYNDYQDPPIILNFHMRYFNSTSSKSLLDIMYKLLEFKAKGLELKVVWYYDEGDDTIQEAGEELSELINYPFEYVGK